MVYLGNPTLYNRAFCINRIEFYIISQNLNLLKKQNPTKYNWEECKLALTCFMGHALIERIWGHDWQLHNHHWVGKNSQKKGFGEHQKQGGMRKLAKLEGDSTAVLVAFFYYPVSWTDLKTLFSFFNFLRWQKSMYT